jgi:hypothetical protein
MATGDQNDIVGRLKATIPASWFPTVAPVLQSVLAGASAGLAFFYQLIAYAKLQARIGTATDGWLDLASYDFFGGQLPRQSGELDGSFRPRIISSILREKATRAGMIATLQALTGQKPIIFEPARVQDTGAYNAPISGYGVAGGYGSLLLPTQAFITAFRPASGIPTVAGYGVPVGAYSTPSQIEYGSLDMIQDQISDATIYAAVDATKPAGTTMWTRIENAAA